MNCFKVSTIISAAFNSFAGLKVAFCEEHAFREIIILAAVGIPLAIYLADNFTTAFVLILPFFLCMTVELLNTAIENICDKITTEYDLFVKKAKDIGSAAQFISQIFLLSIWIGYFFVYHI